MAAVAATKTAAAMAAVSTRRALLLRTYRFGKFFPRDTCVVKFINFTPTKIVTSGKLQVASKFKTDAGLANLATGSAAP